MRVLIVGETWNTFHIHVKGFDPFFNSTYENGAGWLRGALEANGCEVVHITNHDAPVAFPMTMDELKTYDVVLLSDIGANTILLHPDTFARSQRTPNRLKLMKEYVANGGGLAMIGGYLTFQGIDAKGQWSATAVEEALPVNISTTDDRQEVPEGFEPTVRKKGHPILEGIPEQWPWFLGYNKLREKDDADVLLEHEGDPFLAVRTFGKGRTGAFASDCAPHWGSHAFVEWEYYQKFWFQFIQWLGSGR